MNDLKYILVLFVNLTIDKHLMKFTVLNKFR